MIPFERWTPVRYVRFLEVCESCRRTILRQSPGSTTGTRGTKAFRSAERHVWQCMGCRLEQAQVEAACTDCLGCRALVARFLSPAGWIHRTVAGVENPCTVAELSVVGSGSQEGA